MSFLRNLRNVKLPNYEGTPYRYIYRATTIYDCPKIFGVFDTLNPAPRFNHPAGYAYDVRRTFTDQIHYIGCSDWEYITGSPYSDRLEGNSGNDILYGRGGADILIGGTGNDLLSGNTGDDILLGGKDEDVLYGGDGKDYLEGGDDDDILRGGSNDDQLIGGHGNDKLNGEDGRDFLDGGEGNDKLNGGDGRDILDGGDGHDYLYGGNGDDSLDGGDGNDVFTMSKGHDFIFGGEGTDTYRTKLGRSSRVSLSEERQIIDKNSSVVLIGIENLEGADRADVLMGNDQDNLLRGMEGDDMLYGAGGNDLIEGGQGGDWIDGGRGDDFLIGGTGDDIFLGKDGNDIIIGGTGMDAIYFSGENNRVDLRISPGERQDTGEGLDAILDVENIHGGGGNDLIIGNYQNNMLYGDQGNDVINGWSGSDWIYGGRGDDFIYAGPGYRNDTNYLHGEAGRDTIVAGGDSVDQMWGGEGRDTFQLTRGRGVAYINDFQDGLDQITLFNAAGLDGRTRAMAVGRDAHIFLDGDLMAVVKNAVGSLQFDDTGTSLF